MICSSCGEEMVPLRDLICASGTETCCVPCWSCPTCNDVVYLHSETEFDRWIDEFTDSVDFGDIDLSQEIAKLDNRSRKLLAGM